MIWAAAGLLAGLLGLGAIERRLRDQAHGAVPIRIHVNGTRGKSSVTRLIAAALRESGVPTLAKTTGTEARLILPDGGEESILRRSPPSIREQLWVLRRATRAGAQAVVVECMAIDPALQRVSEHDMLRSTIGVITNVRHDHGDVMGTTIEEVAIALGATLPRGGIAVLGDRPGVAVLERIASEAGAHVVRAWDQAPMPAAVIEHRAWMRENIATALAVTRHLGIDDEVAVRGMRLARPDPGAATTWPMRIGDRDVRLIDATAANDPESLATILDGRTTAHVFVFHHRADRPFRLRQFADALPWHHPDDTVVLTGDRPDYLTRRRIRRTIGQRRSMTVSSRRLAGGIRRALDESPLASAVVCCGNARGFSADRLRGSIQEA